MNQTSANFTDVRWVLQYVYVHVSQTQSMTHLRLKK